VGQLSQRVVPFGLVLSNDPTPELSAGYVRWTIYPTDPMSAGVERITYETEVRANQLIVHVTTHTRRLPDHVIIPDLAIDDDRETAAR